MNPSIWGPSAWRFLHSVAFTYPPQPTRTDRQRYKQFFESLCYVLPCPTCCFNFQKELTVFDLDSALESRESLSRWVFDLHSSVNERTGKKIMTYEEVERMYNKLIQYGDNSFSLIDYKPHLLVGSGILVSSFLYYKYIKKKHKK